MLQSLRPDALLALTGRRQRCTSMYSCPSILAAKPHITEARRGTRRSAGAEPAGIQTHFQVYHPSDCAVKVHTLTFLSDHISTGPDAPLVLDRRVSATHFEHAHDFYKPAGGFFPVVCSLLHPGPPSS